ncbi:MAG: PAS domain-containing protein, partial [Candidatus Eisenbacteria bacterium]|nr:PAS domain-containing protein [Candidatus Eisenbacteria bacterium]
TLDSSGRVFKKRRDVKLGDYFKLSVRGSHAVAPPIPTRGRDADAQVLRDLIDMILPNFGHAAILTDELGHVLSIHGDGSRFLRFPSGDLDTHVTRLVRDEFSIPLKVALRRSSSTLETVDLPPIRTSNGEQSKDEAVRVSVRHRQDRKGVQRFLVVFRVDGASRASAPALKVPASVEDHMTELEDELKETRVLLTSAVEELSASNEEQQTTNEELLAANEELQSTNEELQSVNEELHTVNAEYQKKIQELSELTHDLDSLLESSRIGTIFLDDDLCVRKFTDSATEIVALRPSDVGRPIRQLSNELATFDLFGHLTTTRQDRVARQTEVQTLDGRWFLLRSHPYDVSGFGENGIVLTFVDITRMKESEDALRNSEERFGLVIEGSQDGIWDWDPVSDSAFVSKRWLEIHGLDPTMNPVNKEAWASSIHPDDRGSMQQRLAAHLESDAPYDHEYRVLHSDGSTRWVRNRGKCIRNESGAATRVCGTTTDITVVKAGEAQLRSAYESVSKSNQELDDLTYIASHDLKEPLRGINSLSQILIEDHGERLNEDGLKRLERLQVLTTRLEGLIDGLLHYSKLGRVEANTEEVSLSNLVGEIAETVRLSSETAKVTVKPLPNVVCDAVRVGEVFRNLISNGLKYNESEAPQVEVGVVDQREALPPGSPGIPSDTPVFYVRDNGIGIDSRHGEAVFQMFRRLHPRDAFGGGTGAGLSIAKRIVELHGGTIWLYSKPAEGSTFFFTLE